MSISYSVQKSSSQDGPWTDIATGLTSTSTTVSGQPTNTGFYVRIKRDDTGVITYSDPQLVVMLDQPVLSATGGASSCITLSWVATCATNYYVYKWNDNVHDYIFLAQTGDVTSFQDYAVAPGKTYHYYITGVTPEGYESDPSIPISCYVTQEDLFTMARATEYQGIQIGLESTKGTAVSVTKKLRGMSVNISPKPQIKPVRYAGTKNAVAVQKGKEMSEGSYDGVLDFNTIVFILNSLFGAPSSTSSPATGAYAYTWTPEPETPITPKTYTLEIGSSAGAEKYPFLVFNSLNIKLGEQDADISGDIFAGEVSRNITRTSNFSGTCGAAILGATSVSLTSVTPTSGSIPAGSYITRAGKLIVTSSTTTVTAGSATMTCSALAAAISSGDILDSIYRVPNLAANPISVGIYYSTDGSSFTRMTDVLDFDMKFSGLWNQVFHVNDSLNTFDDLVEMMPDFTTDMHIDEAGSASEHDLFYGYMTNGTKIWISFQVQGALITGSTYELIRFRWPVYVTDSGYEDTDGVHSGRFTLVSAFDETYTMANLYVINRMPVIFS